MPEAHQLLQDAEAVLHGRWVSKQIQRLIDPVKLRHRTVLLARDAGATHDRLTVAAKLPHIRT